MVGRATGLGERLARLRQRVADAAIWFYNTFIPGDPVIIKNTVGPNLEVWDGYGDFQLRFEEYIAAT